MIFLQAIASLVMRFGLAVPFYRSGLVRWDGPFELSPATAFLYEYDYTLKWPAQVGLVEGPITLPYPEIFAWAGSFAEICLPAALVIGFATRLSALGLLGMAIVIFMVNPASWPNESLPWAAMAMGLIAYGPGWLSFDKLIKSSWKKR
ncbi:MAG: DoxX family protein [Hyphomicrobiales bacterium]|nr:DoxX family protein [Hyphomicrobiales bacterium]